MHIKADALFLEVVDQFGCHAGQVDPQALHPVVQVRVDCFDNGGATAIEDIHGGHPARFDVIKETAVTHASNGGVAATGKGACFDRAIGSAGCGSEPGGTTGKDLPAQKRRQQKWQAPESK